MVLTPLHRVIRPLLDSDESCALVKVRIPPV